jgi:hypothetical protein
MLIRPEWVENAVEYLMGNSQAAAAAKGMVVRCEYQRKRVRAQLILMAEGTSLHKEAWAEAHADYEIACEKLAQAEVDYEFHRNERNKCMAILDTFRTQEATSRQLSRAI